MRIAVILGSTRPIVRLGERVAKWIMTETKKYSDAEFVLLDLRDYNIPLYDEAESPRGNKNYSPPENIKKWLNDLKDADGYIFLTPEYNDAPPAALKNALDFVASETKRKPAAIIGYTEGANGATNAMFQLRPLLVPAHIMAIPNQQVILNADKIISEDGIASEEAKENLERRFARLLDGLFWYTRALKEARDKTS